MSKTITKAFIEKQIKARPTKETIFFDHEVRGFYVRVRPVGRPGFGFRWTENGKNRWSAIGLYPEFSVEDAREKAREHRRTIQGGGMPKVEITKSPDEGCMLFGEFLDRYMEKHVEKKNKPSTQRQVRYVIKRFLREEIGELPLKSVRKIHILDILDEIDSVYMHNRVRAHVVAMFNYAEERDLIPEGSNPAAKIKRRKGEAKRNRPVYPHEIQSLLLSLDKHEKDFPSVILLIRLLMVTGARLSEILNAKLANCDRLGGRIKLEDSKTGEDWLTAPDIAFQLIERHPRRASDVYVIPGRFPGEPMVKPYTSWYQILRSAGLKDFRFHDLRHIMGSYASALGVAPRTIQDVLRHSDMEMTQVYIQTFNRPRQIAVERVAETLFGFKESPLLEGVTH